MGDVPWRGDACSLVDELREGRRSAVEALEATDAAAASSALDALSFGPRDSGSPV